MTTKTLVQRLRALAPNSRLSVEQGQLVTDAADEIEKQDIQKAVLLREIERLRITIGHLCERIRRGESDPELKHEDALEPLP